MSKPKLQTQRHTTDFNKDHFDALLKLADFRRSVRESRRETEWKISIATWGLIVGCAAVAPNSNRVAILVALALSILFLHFIWVAWNHKKNERNAVQMYNHLETAQDMLPEEFRQEPEQKPKELVEHLPAFSQVTVSLILAVSVIVFAIFGK